MWVFKIYDIRMIFLTIYSKLRSSKNQSKDRTSTRRDRSREERQNRNDSKEKRTSSVDTSRNSRNAKAINSIEGRNSGNSSKVNMFYHYQKYI